MPFSPMLLLGGRGGGRIGYIVLLFALYLFLSARHPGEGKQRGALRRFDKMFGSRPSLPKSTQASQSSPASPQYSPWLKGSISNHTLIFQPNYQTL